MSWVIDEYKITYEDKYVGQYYVFNDHTYRYYVNSWEHVIESIKHAQKTACTSSPLSSIPPSSSQNSSVTTR